MKQIIQYITGIALLVFSITWALLLAFRDPSLTWQELWILYWKEYIIICTFFFVGYLCMMGWDKRRVR